MATKMLCTLDVRKCESHASSGIVFTARPAFAAPLSSLSLPIFHPDHSISPSSLAPTHNHTRPPITPPSVARQAPRASLPPKHGNPSISRRRSIQLVNGLLGIATLNLLSRMRNSFPFITPRGVATALGAGVRAPPSTNNSAAFILRAEGRGAAAPPFPAGAEWLNSRPLGRDDLRGKLVLLDFWTGCCVNCVHGMPRIAEIRERYGEDGSGGVVVVGVYCAKFPGERGGKSFRAAVERLALKHPVVRDEKMEVWGGVGVSGWPSLCLVSPRGNMLGLWAGEGQDKAVRDFMDAALEVYQDEIDHRPLPEAPTGGMASAEGVLRYPANVAVGEGGLLYVADSGNHRVIVVDSASGAVVSVYGSGKRELVDGNDGGEVGFHSPQGLAVDGSRVWVADTGNHAVRLIDTVTKTVSTVGGSGVQGFDYAAGSVGVQQVMSSPWDVEFDSETCVLYVAMAGIHQIWCVDASGADGGASAPWEVYSGTGRELEKNSSSKMSASWAQPSGLSLNSGRSGERLLWISDSESSTVRVIEVEGGGTRTVAGGDGLLAENLFAFGDKDGKGPVAKFQHPLGICDAGDGATIFCCDSYNNKIKRVARDGSVTTFAGSGEPGLVDGTGKDAQFWEPAGLALSADAKTLFVVDANNYAIRSVDVDSAVVSTIELSALPSNSSSARQPVAQRLVPNRQFAKFLTTPKPERQTEDVDLEVILPTDCQFTEGTTSRWQANRTSDEPGAGIEIIGEGELALDLAARVARVELPAHLLRASEIELVVFYCSASDSTCRLESVVWQLVEESGDNVMSIVRHIINP